MAHSLTYETDGGLIDSSHPSVNLRGCLLVVMLDNLLTLTFQKDPIPGHSRSHQICTLPITIQGLPENSKVTESWHDESLCNGSHNCACKKDVVHQQKDANQILLLMAAEKEAKLQFIKVCNWRNTLTWKHMMFASDSPNDHSVRIESDFIMAESENVESAKGASTQDVFGDISGILQNQPSEDIGNRFNSGKETAPLDKIFDKAHFKTPITLSTFNVENLQSNTWDSDVEGHESEETDLENLHSILRQAIAGDYDFSLESDIPESHSLSEINPPLDQPTTDQPTTDQPTTDETDQSNTQNILSSFGFNKYKVPQLLTRHPPPAIGRDDDISKLQEILYDILVKSGTCVNPSCCKSKS